MEVHHHPHVEKKNFKEYLLEFVMIFLAVTLGFFAENIREHVADHAKEKEYILAMIEDAATDTANIDRAVAQNRIRDLHLVSLANLCMDFDPKDDSDAAFYREWEFGMAHPDLISPTERTMQQLKGGGGMRLIRKRAAIDSIVSYDDAARKLADQQGYYELYQNQCAATSLALFNFRKFSFIRKNFAIASTDTSCRLLTRNKATCMELGNKVFLYAGVVRFYNIRLLEMKDHGVALITTLKKEYGIED